MIRDIHAASRRDRKKASRCVVVLNGIDVSRDAFYADDRRGLVRLYRRNSYGVPLVDVQHNLVRDELRGTVQIAAR